MKTIAASALLVILTGLIWAQEPATDRIKPSSRFAAIAILIDAHDQPLAAWQFEFETAKGAGQVVIVGLEGGDHAAFKDAPYYDPKAIQQERVIVANFNTGPAEQLPKGKTRVATIHVMISGDVEPRYEIKLTASATTDGTKIPADISIQEGTGK